MIYLIGGPHRVGKSTLAKMILKKDQISYAPTDALFHMVQNAAPETGMHERDGFPNKADRFYPFLKNFILHAHWGVGDYLIEGDTIHPQQVYKLSQDADAKNVPIKSCFLGLSKTSAQELKKYAGYNNWIGSKTDQQLEQIAKTTMELSNYMKEECQKYGYQYFDLSGDYHANLEKAYSYLSS